MIFRAVDESNEIVGSIEVGDVSVNDTWMYRTDDIVTRISYNCLIVPFWIDEDGNIIEKFDFARIGLFSNKVELFIRVTNDMIGIIPGWIRKSPSRIIDIPHQ